MKNLCAFLIFFLFISSTYGQFYDDCATAGANIDNIVSGAIPYSTSGSIPNTFTDDGSYDATESFDDGSDCTVLNVSAGGGCTTGNGPNGLGTVDPNTTYLIGVGSTGDAGGDYELEIKITSAPPRIGDEVWADNNGNGIKDAGDFGLGGVVVNLYDNTGVYIATTTTSLIAPIGKYYFEDIAPGDYYLEFLASGIDPNYIPTYPDFGGDDAIDSDVTGANGAQTTDVFTVTVGMDDLNFDAGFYIESTIGDYMWEDQNANGIQDVGEPKVGAGFQVTIDGTDGTGALYGPINTTTDANGNYSFKVPPGNYKLTFELGGFSVFTYQDEGADDELDNDVDNTGETGFFDVESDDDRYDTEMDAGVYTYANIGDYTWEDLNVNGIQDDGEPVLADIDVTMNGATGNGTAVSITNNSSALGIYTFNQVIPGTYTLTFAEPEPYHRTYQDEGGDDTVDSDPDQTTGDAPSITVISAQIVDNIDAGYYSINCPMPINDSPCNSDPNPPYDLAYDGSHSGTTCCAIGYNDDPNSDFANIECDAETDDDAVWYRANIDSDFNGIKISISNGSIGSNMSVEVYSGYDDAVCDETAVFVTSECGGLPFDDIEISCLENVEFIFIKVSSSESDCGTFDISVEPYDDCNLVPNCTNLIDPVDGQTNVEVTTSLTWQEVSEASGYYLTIGTEEGLGDILDNEDVGDEKTYDPDTLPCNSNIYVTIVPYNDYGNAENCAEESFTTEFVIANAGNDVVICKGEEAQLQAGGGTTYSWSPIEGLNNPNISNPIASPQITTTYTVLVSNENGCNDFDSVIVNVNLKAVPNVSSTNETGEDTNDGTATSMPYSGQPPYSYIWNTGATSNFITGLSPGNYSVTVTDSNGCSASESVTILEFGCNNLLLYATKTDINCFDQCDGKVTIDSVIGGLSPLQYLWSNGDTVSEINNLCQGEYNVTVTDANNCNVFGVFQIISPAELNVNTISTDETSADANDGTASCLPSGGIAPYSYSWSNGDTDQSIDSLSPGTYYLTVTDANTCTVYDTVTILAFNNCLNLSVVSQKIDASCFGVCDGVISIVAVNNSTPPLTYSWSNGANTSLINNLCAGDYYVTINDANDCVLVDTVTINQPDIINIMVDTVINISNNSLGAIVISIDNKDKYTFNWKGPGDYSSDKEYILNLDTSGCYTLIVTDTLTNCSTDTTICITDKTGIDENKVLYSIEIYPNPAMKNLYIDFIGNMDLEAVINLYDISGKKTYSVIKKSGERIIEINTLGINQGIYIVKVKLNDRVLYKKVVIAR